MDKIVPCPCKPDCPKRTANCRLTCVKHKVYVAFRTKEYAKRATERKEKQLVHGYYEAQRKKIQRYQSKSKTN